MQARHPTFVSLWIGNNDVLGVTHQFGQPGQPGPGDSATWLPGQYSEILDSIEAEGANAVLFSVADVAVIPYASRGRSTGA